jgi:UDP-GlcNAc:undecaprenyl-phosphate GlcNAc-1-phosphate transferase
MSSVRLIYYFISYFAVAFGLALALTPLMRPVSFRLGAIDTGTGRRVHTGRIPRLGGAGIFAAFMMPAAFSLTRGEWDSFHYSLTGILIASTIVFCIGLYDDLKGATIKNKLLAEVLAASFIFFWGIRITVISNPFGPPITLGWMSFPVTVLWVVVVTNAINLIDGMDGLAAGTGILISFTLFSLSASDTHMQLAFIIMAGGLAGFLIYNFPPASIFMGDSGSLFLGFFLGALSILSSRKATAIATIMIPIIAFSFPLMDMFYAVLRRFFRGLPLGEADKEHIHHKLLDKGLSKRKVLLVLYAFNIFIMISVLLVVRRQLNADFFGVLLLTGLGVFGLRILGYIEFLPFIKEIFRGHIMARKRKYFNYVITKFKQEAAKSMSADDLRSCLTAMVKEYNFSYTEVHLELPGINNPFYLFVDENKTGNPLKLSFPLTMRQNEFIGYIQIRKQVDDDYFLCTAELVKALSEEVVRFTVNNLDPAKEAGRDDLP